MKKDRSKPTCPYCLNQAVRTTGEKVYPNRPDLGSKVFWVCWQCNARCGCHPGTELPLGTLADRELRVMRAKAHEAIDPIWKSGRMSRNDVYRWLAKVLNIPKRECHVAMFDELKCRQAIEACEKLEEGERVRGERQGAASINERFRVFEGGTETVALAFGRESRLEIADIIGALERAEHYLLKGEGHARIIVLRGEFTVAPPGGWPEI